MRALVTPACVVGLVLAAVTSCGGEGVSAPHVIGAREDTGCPSADEALANVRGALGIDDRGGNDDVLGGLRAVLSEVLVEQGGLRVLVQGAAVLLADASRITLDRFLAGIDPVRGLGGLTPHAVEVLRYIDGSSAHVPGAHLQCMAALHDIVGSCDAAATLSTLRLLWEIEVVDGVFGPELRPPGLGARSFLAAVLDRVKVALDEPALRDVLATIELSDPDGNNEGGTIRVGKEAFVLLARLLGANLAAPDFDPDYARALLEDVILARVTDEVARAKVDALLDLLLLLADPNAGASVFPQMQALMGCVRGADPSGALPSLLYDWLTIEGLSADAFVTDLALATGSSAADDLRLAFIDLLGALEAAPSVSNDLARVLARFLEEDNAALLVKTMLRLQGRGVLAEAARLTDAIESCHPPLAGNAL